MATDTAASDDATSIGLDGWRQGSVAPSPLAGSPTGNGPRVSAENGDLLIIVSHDCDVTNPSYLREPNVELIVARPINKLDGSCTRGKNPRVLHLTIETPRGDRPYALAANDRFMISRCALATRKPLTDYVLGLDDRRLLAQWLAKRYIRAAFPGTFNHRTRPANDRIRRLLTEGGLCILGIYVAVPDDELPDGCDYEIVLRALIGRDDFDNTQTRLVAEKCIGSLAVALNDCKGIAVLNYELIVDDEFSFADMTKMKRWDFDWLSLKDD